MLDEVLNYRGNPHYVAPEVMRRQDGHSLHGATRFGRRRDVFSAGIVFAELLLDVDHMLSYDVDDDGAVYDKDIIEAHDALRQRSSAMTPVAALSCYGEFVLPDEAFNQAAADLVVKMLTWDRISRPSPEKLLQNPFFSRLS